METLFNLIDLPTRTAALEKTPGYVVTAFEDFLKENGYIIDKDGSFSPLSI